MEIDAFNAAQGTPLPGSYIRIWGISIQDIGRASDFNGHDLVLKGGMGKGLPLANPAQAGILIQGHIQQAFSNWIGTDMTLDLILVAGSISAGTGAAQNIHVNWPPNQPMSQMLNNLLGTLFPQAKLNINISDKLRLPYHERHFAGTMIQFADYLIDQSRRILNTGPALSGMWNTVNNALSTYAGVQLHIDGSTVNVYDGTKQQNTKQITIFDLVGQPTWIGPQQIQVTCVMRADIQVGNFITLPPTRARVTSASLSPYSQQRQDIIFQGSFFVTQIHHVGNYKDPGALSWVTVIDASVNVQTQTTQTASGQGQDTGPVKASVQIEDVSLNPPSPTGGPGITPSGTIESTDTAPDVGLGTKYSPAPSTGIGTGNSSGLTSSQPTTITTLDSGVANTATGAGLKVSAPAPSMGESYNPGTIGGASF